MSDQIRAEAVEVLARANFERFCKTATWEEIDESERATWIPNAEALADALAAAGLLPTIVEVADTGVWGTDRFARRRVRYLTEWREVFK